MEQENPQNVAQEPNSFKKYLNFIWEIFKIAVVALVIVLPIRYFLFQPFIVKGESMVPSFQSGDYLIVDEFSYRFSEPQRGDVIVFKYPKDATQRFIKRVIGLPGETIEIKNGAVTIPQGDKTMTLDEKYLPDSLKTAGDLKVQLGQDEYFVMGDNREYSYDSRAWGVVPRENIIGKVFFRLLPVNALSAISKPTY